MILPTTNLADLILLIASMLCLGTWALTQKAAREWRYELYYYDFAVGVLLCAVIAAFTLGSLHSQDLTFSDILLIAGRRQLAWAFMAGAVFNVANMLLLASMQVSGMAVAFPITFGLALSIGAIVKYLTTPGANALMLFSGAVLGLVAVAVCAYTSGSYSDGKKPAEKPLRPDPRAARPKATKTASAAAGVALALFSGVILSVANPLVGWAKEGEGAVISYSLALIFSGGLLLSAIICGPFFMTFPVHGSPVSFKDFFSGRVTQHLWGVLGGVIFMAGLEMLFASYTLSAPLQPSAPVTFGLQQGSAIIAALAGLLFLREFNGAGARVRMLLVAMLVLLAAGIGVVGVAPLYVK